MIAVKGKRSDRSPHVSFATYGKKFIQATALSNLNPTYVVGKNINKRAGQVGSVWACLSASLLVLPVMQIQVFLGFRTISLIYPRNLMNPAQGAPQMIDINLSLTIMMRQMPDSLSIFRHLD